MKYCRFQLNGEAQYGLVEKVAGRETIQRTLLTPPEESNGDVEGLRTRRIDAIALEDAALLPPVRPSKIVCVGRNYRAHAAELGHDVPKEPLAGDGLVTNTPGLLLAVLTADCLPVILVDTKRRAVGVLHAGWRGTAKRIVEKGVGEMRHWFGTLPRDIKAAIGPGIHGCCYQVGPEVRQQFESQFGYAGKLFREIKESDEVREKYPLLFLSARAPGHSELPKKIFLDLVEANRRQLIDAGVPKKFITASPECTSCRVDLLFSHRAENGITGRMMAAVGVRPAVSSKKRNWELRTGN